LRVDELEFRAIPAAKPITGLVASIMPENKPEKAVSMESKLYVGNLSKSTTQDELNVLFTQAGKVASVELIKDRKSGESKGFAFVTMSEGTEADKAVSMFNSYSLSDHELKVSPAKPH
jgi:RNA recognition motif-containing protein